MFIDNKKMMNVKKRIFDTEKALKGAYNGRFGKWQLFSYSLLTLAFAITYGWISRMYHYSLSDPNIVDCEDFDAKYDHLGFRSRSIFQRLAGREKYIVNITLPDNTTMKLNYNITKKTDFETVITEYKLFCDLEKYSQIPRYAHLIGTALGALLLGILADKGGRKIIILGCIWTTGILSIFQLVGHDFISYSFFQFFLSIFSGGILAAFVPTIIEMFPIRSRAFYGVLFHLVVSIFIIVLPLFPKIIKKWSTLQMIVTAPLVLTAPLQWIAFESMFWYLAYKEYDKAIQDLTVLAKRNGIAFEEKFKQAKEFLHAKHSKATQCDIMPLLRLKDVEHLGKKYPTVDMAELQKQKANSSKLRRFLNSLKGQHYRSTNTIYRPFDFIYSPTFLTYVFILCGLWFTNGLGESIDAIKRDYPPFDQYIQECLINLIYVLSSLTAIILSIFKIPRRWMIFMSFLFLEICLLGSLISNDNGFKPINNGVIDKNHNEKIEVALHIIYFTSKFATHFGFMFLMLATAELFPTSLRCTGVGFCLVFKLLGELLASKQLLDFNEKMPRLAYGLVTLFFGALSLFLPETKNLPLPRTILQVEAMHTTIGKKFQSRKLKAAYEKSLLKQREEDSQGSREGGTKRRDYNDENVHLNATRTTHETSKLLNNSSANDQSYLLNDTNMPRNSNPNNIGSNNANAKITISGVNGHYDTVTSVHDIEQDSHAYYPYYPEHGLNDPRLPHIAEVPSKNITRNNSIVDASDIINLKL